MRVKDDPIIISGPAEDLEIFGGKIVRKDTYLSDKRLEEEYVAIKLCEGIEGSFDGIETVEEGFLDRIPHLHELEMADTVKDVGVTEQFKKVMHKNNILIRGSFDSYAEEFARKYKLRFLPSNMVLAQTGDYYTNYGVDIITLRMFDDGTADIHQDERCQGSSASWVGGGDISLDIRWDFFKDENAQEIIASKCWGNCREIIKENKIFAEFLQKAREKYKTEKHKKLVIYF